MPPLSDRPDDIPLLARHFVQKFSREFGKSIVGPTPPRTILLQRHNWPGNVRELEHAIVSACMLSENVSIDVGDLPQELARTNAASSEESAISVSHLADQERRIVEDALRESGGNQSKAARRLDIGS